MNNLNETLEAFKAWVQEKGQDNLRYIWRDSLDRMPTVVITHTEGARYIRICTEDTLGYSKSVYCFLDKTNGNLLKGSWKAPVKNGVRGNIFEGKDHWESRFNHHGPNYLR